MRIHPLSTASLLAPAGLLATVLLFIPVLAVVLMSLTDWQFGATTLNWVGLQNYAELWSDAVFRKSVANTDRKSTRLNSSHTVISYAVFCLKKTTALTLGTRAIPALPGRDPPRPRRGASTRYYALHA